MATYSDIVTGLHGRFATIGTLKNILAFEPASVNATPMLYSLFVSMANNDRGQVKARTYRTMHRLVVARQDYAQAELLLNPYLESIPDAVKADPRLGGTLTSGLASIVEARGGYASINGVVYRIVDFFSEVVDKS